MWLIPSLKDHHHALVLALRIRQAAAKNALDVELANEVRRAFDSELSPHFALEEEELLPALRQAGRPDLADRTVAEHGVLRDHRDRIEAGELHRLEPFGVLLEAHVRFEENELFPACEKLAGDDVLARVARRAPKGGPGY